MLDSHCHLDDPRLAHDLPEVLRRAREAGVRGMVTAGYGPERWPEQARIALENPDVAAAYGVHPWRAFEGDEGLAERLEDWLADPPAPPVGLGELGLDRSPRAPKGSEARQEALFRRQLALARDLDLPVILHVVRAHGAALEILRRDGLPRAGGMVHGFRGPAEVARDYLALGLHLSFSAAAARPGAHRLREVLRAVPAERLLLETDSPDQARDGGRNEPALLGQVLEAAAEARGVDPAGLARLTEENARRLFRLST